MNLSSSTMQVITAISRPLSQYSNVFNQMMELAMMALAVAILMPVMLIQIVWPVATV